MSELKITPLVHILSDSISSLLAPTFPMCGNVKFIICPAYDGSDMISWYPVKEVLKHTSPVASPICPSPIPLKTDLFSRAKIAVLKLERCEVLFFRFKVNYNSWVKG